jgi:hypothetical protein
MDFKKTLSNIVWAVFCAFVGLTLFVGTIVVLNKDKITSSITITKVSEKDSCVFDASNDILGFCKDNGDLIVYIESKPCPSCTKSAMKNLIYFMQDSLTIQKPLFLFHPSSDVDSTVIKDYEIRFSEDFNVVVTREDSIMIKNPWMPNELGFYGIITDSLSRVQYAGWLFDPDFILACKKQFGIVDQI